MSERIIFAWFVERLPIFDPAWPDEIWAAWMACFIELWRWSCRLTVREAIEQYV